MMKKMFLFAIIFILSAPLVHAQYGAWTGNANFFIGGKFMSSRDWSPTDSHFSFGGRFDARPSEFPINFCFDIYRSSDTGTFIITDPILGDVLFNNEAKTTELNFGVRKVLDEIPFFHPYFGGGFAYIEAEAESRALGQTVRDSEWAPGFWFSGGGNWIVSGHFNIGFDVGYSYAKVTLFNTPDIQAGGFRVGAQTGFHW